MCFLQQTQRCMTLPDKQLISLGTYLKIERGAVFKQASKLKSKEVHDHEMK